MSIISLGIESAVRLYRDDVPTVVSPFTGRIWMDRNLGAERVPQTITDSLGLGSLYQWGRLTDGHQLRTSSTTSTKSATAVPGNNLFITATTNPFDWRDPHQNGNSWQGVNGINNPCPAGFRIPYLGEFFDELSVLTIQGLFDSFLKIPCAGNRVESGSIVNVGSHTYMWGAGGNTGPGYRVSEQLLIIGSFNVSGSGVLAQGNSCRCIKNY